MAEFHSFLWLSNIPLSSAPHPLSPFIWSVCDGHLGFFHVLAVVNSAACVILSIGQLSSCFIQVCDENVSGPSPLPLEPLFTSAGVLSSEVSLLSWFFICYLTLFRVSPILISSGCCNNMPWMSGLKKRNICCGPGGWEVQGQGASMARFLCRHSSWLAEGLLLTVASRGTEREQALWCPL